MLPFRCPESQAPVAPPGGLIYTPGMDDTAPGAPLPADPDVSLDLTRLSGSAGFLVRLAQLRIYEAFHAGMARHGLTPTRYSVLALLHDNPGLRPSQIAEALRVKPSNMAPLLAQFEAEGLLERSAHPAERRAVLIRLTASGRALFATIVNPVSRLEAEATAMFSPAERDQLIGLLQRLAQV